MYFPLRAERQKNIDLLDTVLYVLILIFENTTFLHCYNFGFGIKFSNTF